MRICYVVPEYFAWGQYGGYGTITRAVAEGLARREHEIFVLVNKKTPEARREQRDVEVLAGVTVVGLPGGYPARLWRRDLYRLPRADLYVSVDARFDSWWTMRQNPDAKHAIWFIDPMDFETYWGQHRVDPSAARPGEKLATRAVFQALQAFGRLAVQGADALLSQRRVMPPEARAVFAPTAPIRFAPNPVEMPGGSLAKSETPLVIFVGRLDWQKQPEAFFALARALPDVHFVAAGVASDPAADAALRARFGDLPNLELAGVVTGEAKDMLLRRAWILCNTSLREGLPRSFQEALAYGCALVAAVDPDETVSRFGEHAPDRDFARALRALLHGGRWRARGEAGRAYVEATHGSEAALDAHEALYREILA